MHLNEDDGGKPLTRTLPVKFRKSFLADRMSRRVDFPQPDGPNSKKISENIRE